MRAVSEPLASVLRSGREVFNSKFAEARRRYPELQAEVFSEFLCSTLDPIAREANLPSEVLPNLVLAAYDTGLELAGDRFLGNDVRGRVLEDAWRRLIPKALAVSTFAFERLLAAVSNAAINLLHAPHARATQWINELEILLPHCSDFDLLLKVGQVLAWRAGLAHYRTSALEVAATLPARLACLAVGADEKASWPDLHRRLSEDEWFDPSKPDVAERHGLRPAGKAGAFRGLGGNFLEPPTVAAAEGQLFVQSGEECWLLIADVFGHSLHRAEPAEFQRLVDHSVPPSGVEISLEKIVVGAQQLTHAMPGEVTSFALLPRTLAVTSRFTHEIALFAY